MGSARYSHGAPQQGTQEQDSRAHRQGREDQGDDREGLRWLPDDRLPVRGRLHLLGGRARPDQEDEGPRRDLRHRQGVLPGARGAAPRGRLLPQDVRHQGVGGQAAQPDPEDAEQADWDQREDQDPDRGAHGVRDLDLRLDGRGDRGRREPRAGSARDRGHTGRVGARHGALRARAGQEEAEAAIEEPRHLLRQEPRPPGVIRVAGARVLRGSERMAGDAPLELEEGESVSFGEE